MKYLSDDSDRLALVLSAIQRNAKNSNLLYHLAYDIYNESLNHPEGSRSRMNMLNIAFELGLQVSLFITLYKVKIKIKGFLVRGS